MLKKMRFRQKKWFSYKNPGMIIKNTEKFFDLGQTQKVACIDFKCICYILSGFLHCFQRSSHKEVVLKIVALKF